MDTRIFLLVAVLFFLCLFLFAEYKLISWRLKKAIESSKKVLAECKTEEEIINAKKNEIRKNKKKVVVVYLLIFLGVALASFPFVLILKNIFDTKICPTGSYELFRRNNVSYYGKRNHSIFCYNNGSLESSTYKIFDKKEKSVFETKSYEEFMGKLENLFANGKIKKINYYGTCLSDPGYRFLWYALEESNLVENKEMENKEDRQLIHVETKNGTKMEIEYLFEDMICTCSGA